MRQPTCYRLIVRRAADLLGTAALSSATLFGCLCAPAQTATAPADASSQQGTKKLAPTFSAAGIQGNIAPSGYSGGAVEEKARQVASLVIDLQTANVADELPSDAKLSCDLQTELLHAALSQPGSFQANLRLGLFYLQHGDPALSVKYFGRARDITPGDSAVAHYLATAELEANDYPVAGRLAAQLIDANQADAVAHRIKGSVEAATGHAQAALAEYKMSVALDPGANNVFSAGLSFMALGFFADAERMLATKTAAQPGSGKLWLARGMAEILLENRDQAIDSLLRSATLDPTDPLAPTLLAIQADGAVVDNLTSARILSVVQSFVAARPEESTAHYDYALVLLKVSHGAPDAHVGVLIEYELKTAVDEQPHFAAAHFELGIAYENADDGGSAIAEFSRAVALAPDVAEWRYRLARAYRRAGQLLSAAQEMEAFKRLNARRDAGGDVSAKLLDGLPADVLGVLSARCHSGPLNSSP
jgi:tetratricopeptide (TPR) repeat protein